MLLPQFHTIPFLSSRMLWKVAPCLTWPASSVGAGEGWGLGGEGSRWPRHQQGAVRTRLGAPGTAGLALQSGPHPGGGSPAQLVRQTERWFFPPVWDSSTRDPPSEALDRPAPSGGVRLGRKFCVPGCRDCHAEPLSLTPLVNPGSLVDLRLGSKHPQITLRWVNRGRIRKRLPKQGSPQTMSKFPVFEST